MHSSHTNPSGPHCPSALSLPQVMQRISTPHTTTHYTCVGASFMRRTHRAACAYTYATRILIVHRDRTSRTNTLCMRICVSADVTLLPPLYIFISVSFILYKYILLQIVQNCAKFLMSSIIAIVITLMQHLNSSM